MQTLSVSPRVVIGWRHREIDLNYDRAAEVDGYYYLDDVCNSSQTMVRTQITRNYREKEGVKDRVRKIDRDSKAQPLGKTNQIAVLKSIQRQKRGDPPHPKAKIFTQEEWDAIKQILIAKGLVRQGDDTPPNKPLSAEEKQDYLNRTRLQAKKPKAS